MSSHEHDELCVEMGINTLEGFHASLDGRAYKDRMAFIKGVEWTASFDGAADRRQSITRWLRQAAQVLADRVADEYNGGPYKYINGKQIGLACFVVGEHGSVWFDNEVAVCGRARLVRVHLRNTHNARYHGLQFVLSVLADVPSSTRAFHGPSPLSVANTENIYPMVRHTCKSCIGL